MEDLDAAVAVDSRAAAHRVERRDVQSLDIRIDDRIQHTHSDRAAPLVRSLTQDRQVADSVVVHEQPIAGVWRSTINGEPQTSGGSQLQSVSHANANEIIASASLNTSRFHKRKREYLRK